MTIPAPRPRGTRQALAPREFAFGRVARPNLLVVCWRWRYELGGGLASGWALVAAARWIGIGAALGSLAAFAVVIAVWPTSRRAAIARAWWLITPHRVRTGCAQAWIHSRTGKIPVIWRTTVEPFGERVQIWCRAGTSAQDFAWARHLITAACWAREVRVWYHPRHVHLVRLDVIRRDVARPSPDDEDGRLSGDARVVDAMAPLAADGHLPGVVPRRSFDEGERAA
jgi:hypothetical protein